MTDLIEEALRLEAFLHQQGFRFCFIGGLAVQHWGEPRLTRDIDLALMTSFGDEARYADCLLSAYAPRIRDAREFAVANRVLLLRSPAGLGIDVSLAALPFEERMMERALDVEVLSGQSLRLCSPEDLVVMKVFAGREIDTRDARSIIVRQGKATLDWSYIDEQLAELGELKGDASLIVQARRLRDSVS